MAASVARRGPVILASASPRRLDLLRRISADPLVEVADVDESPRPGERPAALVRRLARAKRDAVATRHRSALVVAADTEVVLDGEVLGKPADDADAVAMLRRLSGRSHHVMTGFALACDGAGVDDVVTTTVSFRPLTDDEIHAYVRTGEPAGKAGSYALQGGAGAFATAIDGSDSNVVGLPLAQVVVAARTLGFALGIGGLP